MRHLPQDMIQFRYDAEEKYRNESIEQVKAERQKIMEEDTGEDKEKKTKKKKKKKKKKKIDVFAAKK